MNTVAVIAEYNPMHNGHIYQLEQAKKRSNADAVIVIMSGSLTQQGNVSIYSKFHKASIAIQNGADVVLELPVIHSISSAESFAFSAVKILDDLGIVTHLSFGAECDNIELLKSIATKLLNNEEQILGLTKKHLKNGINVAVARDKALALLLSQEEYSEISKPNNILAIEYLKALIKLRSKITPLAIKRAGNGHNDKNKGQIYSSSTCIREFLKNNKLEETISYIPQNVYKILTTYPHNSNEKLWELLKYQVLTLKEEGLYHIQDVKEGLDKKLYSEIFKSNSYEEYISNVKSKRYTLGRIKRICIYIILNITKEKYNELSNTYFARVLKISNNGKAVLKSVPNLITKITDDSLIKLPKLSRQSIELNILAHNLLFDDKNKDYTNRIEI